MNLVIFELAGDVHHRLISTFPGTKQRKLPLKIRPILAAEPRHCFGAFSFDAMTALARANPILLEAICI
jgi:hypothetical protein